VQLAELAADVAAGKIDPYAAAGRLLAGDVRASTDTS